MTDLNELLERVKKATGPDDKALRYIDCHMWVIAQGGDARMVVCDSSKQDFVWERGIDGLWIRSVVKFRSVPKYTVSVDAALALVERLGWHLYTVDASIKGGLNVMLSGPPRVQWSEEFQSDVTHPDYVGEVHGDFCLAIIAALLSALISKESSNDQ